MPDTTGLQAVFPSDATLRDAMARLSLLGFDRADIIVPDASAWTGAVASPSDQPNSAPMTETDTRQTRTMATSMAATAGAFAAAGVTIATGGAAALAAGAAVAAAAGVGGLSSLGGNAAVETATDQREKAAADGGLALLVRTRQAEKVDAAERALREAGGQVTRLIADKSVDSTAWTG